MRKTISQWISHILSGACDSKFMILYMDNKRIPEERKRYVHALMEFQKLYGEHEVEIYSAPGRSEICGNHTDHQNGKVLATSITLDTIAVVTENAGQEIYLKSEGYEEIKMTLSDLNVNPSEEGTTKALVRGVAFGFSDLGYHIGGFKAYVTSEVLSGSGLSSSAAFETLLGNIFSGLYNESKVDAVTIAKIGQMAENVYFGKPSGLMDQMACSVGGLIHIDFKEKDHPVITKVDCNFNKFDHVLCIVDTKGSHADLTDDYALIPEEMKKVAGFFGKNLLSEVSEVAFYRGINEIREIAGDRAVLRAIHFFEENKRVDEEKRTLELGLFEEFKKTLKKSGDSSFKYLQNVYSIRNVKAQNMALALSLSEKILNDQGVCRVHGGGFAGTIQAFVPTALVSIYKNEIEKYFGLGSCHVLNVREVGGISL